MMKIKQSNLCAPVLAILVGSAAGAPTAAQEDAPTPHPELKRLQRFEGFWKGSGQFSMPEQSGEWSGDMHCSWVLDGFAMEVKRTIDIPGGFQILANSMMGFDPMSGRLKFFDFANDGNPGDVSTASWVDRDTLVSVATSHTDAGPMQRRSTWRFDEDSFSFVHEVLVGAQPPRTEVTAEFRRVEEVADFPEEVRFQYGGPVSPEMQKLDRFLGEWKTEGWMVMPGTGKVSLTGTESTRRRMGGYQLEFDTRGFSGDDPNEYHARSIVEWVPSENRYRLVSFSNMGEFVDCSMTWLDEQTLTNFVHSEWFGQPMLSRNSMKTLDGQIVVDTHAILGMDAPVHLFHIEYQRADD